VQIIAHAILIIAAAISTGITIRYGIFTEDQVANYIRWTLILNVVANVALFFFGAYLTSHASIRLGEIAQKQPIKYNTDAELVAWHEITSFSWRFGLAALVVLTLVVILPSVFIMNLVANVESFQSVLVFIGSAFSALVGIIISALFLEFALLPARLALLPQSYIRQQEGLSGPSIQLRLLILNMVVFVAGVLFILPRGYFEIVRLMKVASILDVQLVEFQRQFLSIFVFAFLIGAGITLLFTRNLFVAFQNILDAMKAVEKGDLTKRATIYGIDETGQMAIYFNEMVEKIEVLQSGLEKQIAERTTDLQKRTAQLQASAMVARQAASIQSIRELLSNVSQLITNQFGFYHTGIFLLDESGEYAILHAASSTGGQRMIERGHRLRVGMQGIVGTVASQKRPRIALDVGSDAVFFDNPDLPETRSEMALPLMTQDKVIGVLDIQSNIPEAFGADDIAIMQTLADQIAVAIENARLLGETQSLLERFELIAAEQTGTAWRERLKRQVYAYTFTPLGLEPGTGKQGTELLQKKSSKQQYPVIEIPIRSRGQTIGNIYLKRRAGDSVWSDKEKNIAGDIAEQVGLALEGARLLEETFQRAQRERLVREVTSHMRETLDIDTVLQTTVREIQQALNLKEAEVRLGFSNGHSEVSDDGNSQDQER
jgi:GAF domain-containing protein/HAMP domain-containing protein